MMMRNGSVLFLPISAGSADDGRTERVMGCIHVAAPRGGKRNSLRGWAGGGQIKYEIKPFKIENKG